jgi:hypothetical protein
MKRRPVRGHSAQRQHGCAVRAHIAAAQIELLARQQRRDAMVAHRAADQHRIAGPNGLQCQPRPLAHADGADAEVGAAPMTPGHDLGVARHHAHAGGACRARETQGQAAQGFEFQALLEHHRQRQPARQGTGHCQVVDAAVHGQ